MAGAFTACGQNDTFATSGTDSIIVESLAETSESAKELQESTAASGNKALVAYFSATHTTEGVAEKIADGLNADLYEIVPAQSYTDAYLNYNDNNSRSTLEMADVAVRPVISGSVENMDQYDVVFIGA